MALFTFVLLFNKVKLLLTIQVLYSRSLLLRYIFWRPDTSLLILGLVIPTLGLY